MKLINTTRTHQELVQNQLDNTDAFLVETYSAGNTDVVFTQAPKHYELLISNKHRAVKDNELEVIREFFLKRKIDKDIVLMDKLRTVHTTIDEISFPTTVIQKIMANTTACFL
ncbi:MAG: DUF1827 family protein [Streptococcus salivarius]